MAGSFSHIIADDGRFTMDLIENLGDAYEALEECFTIIYELSGGDHTKVADACRKYNFPDPWRYRYGDMFKRPGPMKL
jgi:hypothetical protein